MTLSTLFDDGMEPKPYPTGLLVTVRVPGHADTHWCRVEVDLQSGYAELAYWRWGEQRSKGGGYRLSNPEDAARWQAEGEVWSWLSEWELVALQPIGPEDSEYFATAKLTDQVRS